MNKYKSDILALNETWIKHSEDKNTPTIPDYSLKHTPQQSGIRGGGVGFYVRRGIRCSHRPHPKSVVEQMWLKISLPGTGKIAVGTAYRPESVTVEAALESLSESVSAFRYCKHLFILSDFNVDLYR